MKIFKVFLTSQAKKQLNDIRLYITNTLNNPLAANNIYNCIKTALLSLEEFPESHTLANNEPFHSQGIRRLLVKNFSIYFLVNKEKKEVKVTFILGNRMNHFLALNASNL